MLFGSTTQNWKNDVVYEDNKVQFPKDLHTDLWRLCRDYHRTVMGSEYCTLELLLEFSQKVARQVGYLRDGGPER